MKKVTLIMAISAIVLIGPCAFGETLKANGKISNVIVYRGQALVTRTIETALGKGTTELIVTGLPEKIVPESLYSQAPQNVTILSVRYREKTVKEDTREEVKKIDTQIEEVENQLSDEKERRNLINGLINRYDPFWKLTVDTSKSDLDRGLLQFEPIEKLTGHMEAKLRELSKSEWELNDLKTKLTKELKLLSRKREDLKAGHSRTQRQAVVYLTRQTKSQL